MPLKSLAQRILLLLLLSGVLLPIFFFAASQARGQTTDILLGEHAPLRTLRDFDCPHAIAFSPDGRQFYVVDWNNHRVQVVQTTSHKTTVLAGGLGQGKVLIEADATQSQLDGPRAIGVSPDGEKVYVGDTNNRRILIVNTKTRALSVLAGEGSGRPETTLLQEPRAIAVSSDGRSLYVAGWNSAAMDRSPSGGHVVKVDTSTGAIERFAGGGNVTEDVDGADAQEILLTAPESLAISPDGSKVYVVDKAQHRLYAINETTRKAEIVAGRQEEDGAMNTWETTGAARDLRFRDLRAVAVSPGGLLYVADREQQRIFGIDPATKLAHLVACPPEEEGPIRLAGQPFNIAVAPDGSLLISLNGTQVGLISSNDEFEAALTALLNIDERDQQEVANSVTQLELLSTPAINTIRQINKRTSGLDQSSASRVLPSGLVSPDFVGGLGLADELVLFPDLVKLIARWVDSAHAPGGTSAQPFRQLRAKLALRQLQRRHTALKLKGSY